MAGFESKHIERRALEDPRGCVPGSVCMHTFAGGVDHICYKGVLLGGLRLQLRICGQE